MNTLLVCDGFNLADLIVPRFEVASNDHVGLSNPSLLASWADLLLGLGGVLPRKELRVTARAAVVLPHGLRSRKEVNARWTVIDFAAAQGLSPTAAERALVDSGAKPDTPYASLSVTARTLIDLQIALAQDVNLVVLGTLGLDPMGMRAVGTQTSMMLDRCAVLHVFSARLRDDYESRIPFSRILECDRICTEQG